MVIVWKYLDDTIHKIVLRKLIFAVNNLLQDSRQHNISVHFKVHPFYLAKDMQIFPYKITQLAPFLLPFLLKQSLSRSSLLLIEYHITSSFSEYFELFKVQVVRLRNNENLWNCTCVLTEQCFLSNVHVLPAHINNHKEYFETIEQL